MDMASIIAKMGINSKEIGKIINCMEKVNNIGIIIKHMLAVFHMGKRMDLVNIFGMIIQHIKVILKIILFMEREPI